jgi:hypothetical protein
VNDHDLLTAVKEDFAAVRMGVPAEMILAGGSRRRRRRRARGLATAAVLAAGLGLGVFALTSGAIVPGAPAEHAGAQGASSGEHTGGATLAAWTVVMRPDGAVAVTIRDLRNIAGLQRRLNAAHVRAVVYARVERLPGCLNWQGSGHLDAMVTTTGAALRLNDVYFVIHPAVIPRGSTLQIDVLPPGWPSPESAPHQRLPSRAPEVSGVGFGGGPKALDVPTINLSLIHTNSNCS